jgi:hypothetical protein
MPPCECQRVNACVLGRLLALRPDNARLFRALLVAATSGAPGTARLVLDTGNTCSPALPYAHLRTLKHWTSMFDMARR